MGRSRSRSDKSELKALLSWKKIDTNNLKSVNQEPKAICLEMWRYLAEELKTNRCFWMHTVISGRMDYGAYCNSTENCVWLGHFVVQQKLKKHCKSTIFYFIYLFSFCLGPLPWHMEVPRLGVESALWPPTYTRATATRDLSCLCDPQYSSRQRRILNPLSKARDWTRNLMVPSRIH